MRAMVFTGPRVVEMCDVAEPVAGPGELLIEVAACGICGSELHGVTKPGFREPPLVMGHEFSGTTADGRRVSVNPIISCGACGLCRGGQEQLCRDRAIIGIHRAGAFAHLVAVPAAAVHDLPDSLSWLEAALIEPLANAVHAVALADAGPGARIGVAGAGTIGIVSLLVARHAGHRVEIADLSEARLALVTQFGADSAGPALEGEFDVIIDAVGVAATRSASLRQLRPGGTAVWVGLGNADTGFDAQDAVRQGKTIKGSFAYTNAEFAQAVQLATELELGWATPFDLESGAEVFTGLMNGRTDLLKAVLVP